MNNGASFNRVTVNGWLGDTSIRVQVVAFATATATAVGRIWKRAPVAGNARASGTGLLLKRFARSPLVQFASAASSAKFTNFRVVRGAVSSAAVASAYITAIVRPRRLVPCSVSAAAAAGAQVVPRVFATLGATEQIASASALLKPRSFVRGSLDAKARAVAWVRGESFYQVPWDEPAPSERVFRLLAEPTFFTVRGNMGTVAKVRQQPGDVQDYDIDFDEWFPVDDKIATATISCVPAAPTPPSFAIDPVSKRVVKVWFYSGGLTGTDYKVTLRATTTNDGLSTSPPLRTKEVELVVKVRES